VLGNRLDGLRRARAAGVRIGSGSDLLGPLARHKTRELAIKASVLGTHETLIATTKTKTNAELLGIAAEPGTIEPGKRADLLVVDGDPLADIALLQHPDMPMAIVKEGQFHKRQIKERASQHENTQARTRGLSWAHGNRGAAGHRAMG
jgi:imidazolonepropionase-like amidohydrolase